MAEAFRLLGHPHKQSSYSYHEFPYLSGGDVKKRWVTTNGDNPFYSGRKGSIVRRITLDSWESPPFIVVPQTLDELESLWGFHHFVFQAEDKKVFAIAVGNSHFQVCMEWEGDDRLWTQHGMVTEPNIYTRSWLVMNMLSTPLMALPPVDVLLGLPSNQCALQTGNLLEIWKYRNGRLLELMRVVEIP